MFLFLFFKLNIDTRECFCWTKSWSSHVCDSWRSWNGFLVFLRHRSWIPDKNMLVFTATACFFSSILIFSATDSCHGRVFNESFPDIRVTSRDGSISIQRNPRHQQLLHKEKGNQGKSVGTAFPEGSVCPWPGILLQLSMSETSCQSVHDLLLFPSLMNPRWV